ncbi:MAG: ATP-dependent Clp protease ATP-binding subunit ClpA [Pseudomonadota bacterium]|jgi:ATP-dependent Clp protease ATP-binding subunit ClpA
MFSAELGYTLEAAFREASSRRHAFFCLEHILYAFLFDEEIGAILKRCGGDVPTIKKDLEDFFEHHVERSTSTGGVQAMAEEAEPIQTPAVKRVLQRAILHMHSAAKGSITAKEVLVAMFSEEDSHAIFALKKHDISRLDILNCITHGISKVGSDADEDLDEDFSEGEGDEFDEEIPEGRGEAKKGALKRFTEDLTELAERNELDPIIGRESEIDRALKILGRRQKNNPLFLGDPGVGKSAMAHAIAQKISSGAVPETLQGARVFSLSIGSLIAGTKFRGEFEERLRLIVKELSAIPKAILFIDEIHTIVGAGATGTGSMDAANLLKPALASGKLRCIGSTTHEDYKKTFEKDRALSRRFSNIDLREPTVAETVEILRGLKDAFEKHHGVRYSEAALKAAAELSAKHINDRFLPDKAIDVIDEAGAANALKPAAKRKKVLVEKDIEAVVSAVAKVPVKSVSASDEELLKNLEMNLKARVFGQEKAVEAITRAMKRSRAQLKADNKPVGCFLFAGPTGVGKTELAKALAGELGVQFHRFDMSEYMEKHAVARLIGAPPGYVGYEEGGILTDLIRKQPYAVLLFDEIEKAHEDIYNILLQVMDDATLTDSHGKKADFRNVVLIMTTNAGSEKAAALGFGQTVASGNQDAAIKKLFKPEFRNRLDEIIHFNPLSRGIIEQIVMKLIRELETQLKSREVSLTLSDAARGWLAENGFDPLLGARPMARLIQREIKDHLAEEVLFGKLKRGGSVSIDLDPQGLSFNYQ